jgi:hypothetical protein
MRKRKEGCFLNKIPTGNFICTFKTFKFEAQMTEPIEDYDEGDADATLKCDMKASVEFGQMV